MARFVKRHQNHCQITEIIRVYLRYQPNPLYSGPAGVDGHLKTPERVGFSRKKECSPVKEHNVTQEQNETPARSSIWIVIQTGK